MPMYIQHRTARDADYMRVSNNRKCIVVEKGRNVSFYPNTNYNRSVIYNAGRRIENQRI